MSSVGVWYLTRMRINLSECFVLVMNWDQNCRKKFIDFELSFCGRCVVPIVVETTKQENSKERKTKLRFRSKRLIKIQGKIVRVATSRIVVVEPNFNTGRPRFSQRMLNVNDFSAYRTFVPIDRFLAFMDLYHPNIPHVRSRFPAILLVPVHVKKAGFLKRRLKASSLIVNAVKFSHDQGFASYRWAIFFNFPRSC